MIQVVNGSKLRSSEYNEVSNEAATFEDHIHTQYQVGLTFPFDMFLKDRVATWHNICRYGRTAGASYPLISERDGTVYLTYDDEIAELFFRSKEYPSLLTMPSSTYTIRFFSERYQSGSQYDGTFPLKVYMRSKNYGEAAVETMINATAATGAYYHSGEFTFTDDLEYVSFGVRTQYPSAEIEPNGSSWLFVRGFTVNLLV